MTAKEEISLKYRKKWLGMFKDVCLKYVDKDKYAVFLFGTAVSDIIRATDVDIGILGKNKLDEEVKEKIRNEVENSVIPFDIDIVDFCHAEKKFKRVALSSIEVWNKPKHININ
jgi:histidinol phosphatase-like enzyme